VGFFDNSFHSFNVYWFSPLLALQPFASCCSSLFTSSITPYPSLVDGSTTPFLLAVVYIPFDNPSKLVDGSHIGYNFPFFLLFFLLFTIIVKPFLFINCLPFSPLGVFVLSGCPLRLTTPFILFIYLFWHKWKIHCQKEPIHLERKS
jgi:hypothetical protein